jgi:hypothetical protein
MARERIRKATTGTDPTVADTLLSDAAAIYGDARGELGSKSILVLGALASFATETVLAGHFIVQAGKNGFETEAGMALLEYAHRCETQASRAMVAALSACKALLENKKRQPLTVQSWPLANTVRHEGEDDPPEVKP